MGINPYVAVGAAQGLENARRRMREERQENEDRDVQKSELEYARNRRAIEDTREDEAHTYEQGQRPLRERALTAQVDAAETSVKAGKTQLEWAEEDRPGQVEAKKLGLESAKAEFEHNKSSRAREKEKSDLEIQAIRKQMEEEGLGRFLDAIEGGADPEYAVKLFNAQGQNGIRPGSVRYDKATGSLSFTGRDGHQFNGTTAQLRSVLPEKPGAKPMVVGAGGSVYDPKTKKFMQAPGGAGGRGGLGPSGQKLSPFNPQTHGKQTRDLVIQGLGGEWDNQLQKFKVPAGMGEKVSYGTSLADQVIRMTTEEGMQLGPGEVSNIVTSVMRDVRTTGESLKIARGELGVNADQKSLQTRAQQIVDESKIRAAQSLKEELDLVRSTHQQQQNSQAWPPAPETSEDMEGGEALETPPVEMLREGYIQRFQDGSAWTLENGRPVKVEE